MSATDLYARCNFTRSGQPSIRFNVVIKVSGARIEELRQKAENRDRNDNEILGGLAVKLVPVLYPEPDAAFAVGCERYYPDGVIPAEIKNRPQGTEIDEVTFWSI
jgi:hypothetical protein